MRIVFWLIVVTCCVAIARAQSVTSPDFYSDWSRISDAKHEFSFTRLMYSDAGYSDWPRWQADWPEAETHFLQGLERLTRIDTDPEGRLIRLNDPDLFDYPWIYAVEVGSLLVSETEAANLREYLLRGGFLMVDDFHGPWQWQNFEDAMKQVFPERPIVELTDDDEIFHVLYDLDERKQIPGLRALRMGRTWEEGGNLPYWRGIMDDEGRVMVAINFNMDMGDAWEHADWPEYPEPYSALAYRFGVNYIVYAMTH